MASSGSEANFAAGGMLRLLLDVKTSFPYSLPPARQPTTSWAATDQVISALETLPSEEQVKVSRYYFPKDAALSLGSCLLKHLAIVRAVSVPWHESLVKQERAIQNGKPFFEPGGVEFNVSHHGEAAVLIATTLPEVRVGIDVVRVDMEKDPRSVRQNGWNNWVRIYSDVFSPREVETISASIPPSRPSPSDDTIKKALRCFYAHWGLKEAYFKMTGDALLSNLLQQLEFHDVEVPEPASAAALMADKWAWGSSTRASASLQGQVVNNLQLELIALGEHYMVASAVLSGAELPPFTQIDVNRDILPIAQP